MCVLLVRFSGRKHNHVEISRVIPICRNDLRFPTVQDRAWPRSQGLIVSYSAIPPLVFAELARFDKWIKSSYQLSSEFICYSTAICRLGVHVILLCFWRKGRRRKRRKRRRRRKKQYFTSCDPHHDIYTFCYWQIFWHSIWHIFWHFIWHIFWHSIWHIFWHIICSNLLAFYLANILALYLAYLPAFYLTFYLAFYLAYLLAFYLAYLLYIF